MPRVDSPWGIAPLSNRRNRKISDQSVKEIKEALYDEDTRQIRDALALKYGISQGYVRNIARGEAYHWIEPILPTQK